MANTDSEVRYTTQTDLGLEEYKRYVRVMQGSQTKNNAIVIVACAWLILAGAYNIYQGRTVLGIFMIFVGIAAPILVRVGANNQMERDYKKIEDAGGTQFRVRFYDDHFETQNDTSHGTHEYSKLYKIVEAPDDFYLEIEQGHSVIIQKKNCSDELIAFLRTLKR